MKQVEVVEADEATLTPEMADAWAKVFLSIPDRFTSEPATLLATQQTGRRAFLTELTPMYSDVGVQPYEQYTRQIP